MEQFTAAKVNNIISELGINIPIDQFYKEYVFQLLYRLINTLDIKTDRIN